MAHPPPDKSGACERELLYDLGRFLGLPGSTPHGSHFSLVLLNSPRIAAGEGFRTFIPTSPSDAGKGTLPLLSHLVAIFENTHDAIWSVDCDRRFVTFNSFLYDRVLAWWGVEIALGVMHGGTAGEEAEFWNDVYTRTFRGENVVAQREYHNVESEAFIEFSLSPIRDSTGTIIGAAGIGRDITHIRQMSAEIIEREAAFRNVLDSTGDVIWSVDTEYRLTTYNSFLHGIILAAMGKEISVGMSYVELGPPEDDEFWRSSFDRALAGEHITVEREYINPAGHAIVEFSLSPIRENGRIIGVAGVGRDVMRLHEIQDALARSEQAYRQLFEDSPLPMWTLDLETLRFTQFNGAALKFYGYSEEEFRQLTIYDIRPPEDREKFANVTVPALRADRGDRHYQSKHIRKNGKALDVEVFSHYLEIDGRPARLTLVKDITQQRQAELDVIKANERFRLASEAITSVVWEWDRTGYIECFGPLERLLGFTTGEADKVPSQFWKQRIHAEDRWRIGRQFISATQTQSRFEAEFRLRRKNGQYIHTWSTAAIIRNEAGRAIRIIGSTLDITERKQMEFEIRHERELAVIAKERAEEMSRLKSSFLANMSHEIRTPLTAILGFAEILSEDLHDPEKRSHAQMIHSGGKRLLATINQVLDLARIEAGKIELSPTYVRVLPTVEECAATLRPLADKKKLRLRVKERSSNVRASIDTLYFHQVLTNLIGNAIKFTNSGEITVSLWQCNNASDAARFDPLGAAPNEDHLKAGNVSYPCFAIEVHDDGVGISKEFLPRIFDEFKQESVGYNRNYEGTGIGLTITAKLVELMHGSITVRSELDKGSRFIVQLPLA